MTILNAYEVAGSVVFSLMTSLWLCSLWLKDASIVDRFWGLGYVLIAWSLALMHHSRPTAAIILLVMVTVWGLRLSLYIHWRNRGHAEDYRYAAMRAEHGRKFWWYSFFSVFLIQGALMLIVAAPLIVVLAGGERVDSTRGVSPLTSVCIWLWFVGFVFEAGGDWQLYHFKRAGNKAGNKAGKNAAQKHLIMQDPKNPGTQGTLLRTGFWAWTRHPNYFGDALQWWAFGLLAVIQTGQVFVLIGPAVMTLFLRKVSGVDLLEKTLKTQKPGYADYIAKTPAFMPGAKFWMIVGSVSLVLFGLSY